MLKHEKNQNNLNNHEAIMLFIFLQFIKGNVRHDLLRWLEY